MNRSSIVFISRLKDDSIVWQSSKIEIVKDESAKIYAWHSFWNFLQSLEGVDRDPVGFYVKIQTFNDDFTDINEVRHFHARKMPSISDKQHSELEFSVGYEILLWDDEYIPQIIEQEEIENE